MHHRTTASGRLEKLARYPANGSFADVNPRLELEILGQLSDA